MYGSIIDFQRLLRGLCINTYHIYVLQERTAQKNPLLLFDQGVSYMLFLYCICQFHCICFILCFHSVAEDQTIKSILLKPLFFLSNSL